MSEHNPPPLEETLIRYLSAPGANRPGLKQLLAERPEVAEQLQRLLNEYQSTQAREDPTLHESCEAPSPDSEANTLRPSSRDSSASRAGTDVGGVGSESGHDSGEVARFGDYLLLEEVARGGMGVVYRAQQASLNREVALKMILAGQLASESDIARFYAEAEAAARLEHPGIVPIYEVGERDGQHFYAMAYVRGQSLAERTAGGPLDSDEAADVLRQIAEAMQFAHERGVIHRDLKPANVLLDEHGQVRVTDFGLAKRVDEDSQMTATGEVLGTPSYMPPEQARGQLALLGPAADIYSAGGILYSMLTGRPPFRAATSFDTLMQVLDRDPVPPRNFNSHVDRDLETICLKCLQKDISQRYISASELIEEIDRYRRGEPVIASPISPLELLMRWYTRLRGNKVVRVRSATGIGPLPWVDIAVGPDTETGQPHGVARGVIAIGDRAEGVFALGSTAIGVIAGGRTSVGILAWGSYAFGLVAIGAVGVGGLACSAVAAGWTAFGGFAFGWNVFGATGWGKRMVVIGRGDPEALEFFSAWIPQVGIAFGLGIPIVVLGILLFTFVLSLRQRWRTAGR